MSTEKLTAQLIVEIDPKSMSQSEKELERLASPEAIKMSIDLNSLRRQLDVLKRALKEAMEVWDIWLANKIWGEIEITKKKITLLNRELTNFTRTWNKDVSVLWQYFQKLWVDIDNWAGKILTALWGSLAQSAANGLNKIGLWATDLWKRLQEAWVSAEATWMTLGKMFWSWLILAGIAAVWVALYKLWTSAIILWDKLEQASLSFGVMLWWADKAAALLKDLTEFAKKTPFELAWIRDSAKQLLAFGIWADSIVWTLKILGDTAAATWTPLSQIAYAYWQVRTAWQLYGSELRQFTQAWVPLLAELAKMYWVTEAKAKKMVEDWKVWFNDVQQAFVNMTSKWGKFFNMMEVQSTTLTGKVSNLKDTFNSFLEEIGTALLPAAKMFVDITAWLFQRFRDSFKWMQIITTILTAYVIDRFYAVKSSLYSAATFLQQFWVIWYWIFAQLWDNAFVMVKNVWIAFDNLPAYIQWGLQKSLDVLNVFFQSAEQAFIDLWTLFGKEWKLAKWLDVKLDFAWPIKEYESFGSAQLESAVAQVQALNLQKEAYKDNMTEMQDINKVALKEYLTDATSQEDAAKGLNYNLAKIAEDWNADDEKAKKKWADIAKKAEAERKKIMEEAVRNQKKVFQNMKDRREEEIKSIKDYIKKLNDALKDIQDIEKDIQWVNQDAYWKTQDAAWSQYRQLLESKKSLTWDPEKVAELEAIVAQIKELESSWLMDTQTTMKEQSRAWLDKPWQDRFDFQAKLWEIAMEKANKEAELQKKKQEIEANVWMKKEQIKSELLLQEERKVKNEKALKKYEEIINLIEKGITDNTQKEIDKRMSLYAQEEQRLLRLIELRMQAWYAVGAIAPPPVSNTTNNNANVTVNANVANSVDINTLANTLARKIQLSSKWVS